MEVEKKNSDRRVVLSHNGVELYQRRDFNFQQIKQRWAGMPSQRLAIK